MALAKFSRGRKLLIAALGCAGVAGGTSLLALNSVSAEGLALHAPGLPWSHNGPISSFDHASIRRGYQVYKNVCSACHSMKYMYYRQLVGVSHTEEEAKEEASQVMVTDGPDEEGNMFQRPGKLIDKFPQPYPNKKAARAANNGAFPPDLTFVNMARVGREDYIFHLLTGYCDAPAGVTVGEGQYFNPYFPGGAISMAQALYNEAIEYDDGTPATTAQLAKDVCTFLAWSSQKEHDTRKRMLVKFVMISSVMFVLILTWKRQKWTLMKSRRLVFDPPVYKKGATPAK